MGWSSVINHNNNPRPENSSEDDMTIGKYADVEPEQGQEFNVDNGIRNDWETPSYGEDYVSK